MITRLQYMDDPRHLNAHGRYNQAGAALAHRDYYAQFVTPEIKRFVARTIGLATLVGSNDAAFNDIPLIRWDQMHEAIVRCMPAGLRHETGEGNSLGTSVCVAKEAARQVVESFKEAGGSLQEFRDGANVCEYVSTCEVSIKLTPEAFDLLRNMVRPTRASTDDHKELWRAICAARPA